MYIKCPKCYITILTFVVRIISPDGEVWYHDGIETKRQCVREGYLADFTEASLNFQGSKTCVGVVYAL